MLPTRRCPTTGIFGMPQYIAGGESEYAVQIILRFFAVGGLQPDQWHV